MTRLRFVGIVTAFLAVALFAAPAFSQENEPAKDADQAAPAKTAEASAPAVKEEASQPKELSIYGEVQDVNATSASVSVQYYDYDSDEEKTAEISTGKDTKLENAPSVGDIKKGDWVDVIYSMNEGKAVAKSIAVEKEEPLPEEPTAAKPAQEMPEE
jgi:hypothetical protein